MRWLAQEELARVRLILHLHPAPDAPAPPFWPLTGLPGPLTVPLVTVYTKADLAEPPPGSLAVSALTGAGRAELLRAIRPHLIEAPFEFDPADVGTQPVRFFATEYLREAAFQYLDEEVPYAVAAQVEEFREHANPVYIRVSLLVERASQKGIVIGSGGRTLKAIGQHARARLEALLGQQVYLDCWVKVAPDWRRKAHLLTELGFPEPPRVTP
jgi:GTP-binding protein Era